MRRGEESKLVTMGLKCGGDSGVDCETLRTGLSGGGEDVLEELARQLGVPPERLRLSRG